MSTTYGTASSITIPSDGDTIDAADVNTPLGAIWDQHDVLADTAALTAILVPTHGLIRYVRGYGHYVFVTSGTYSASTASSPWILAAGDGTPGRWVLDLTSQAITTVVRTLRVSRSVIGVTAITAKSGTIGGPFDEVPSTATPLLNFFTGYAWFADVNAATASTRHLCVSLDDSLVHGATLDSVKLYLSGKAGHGGLPAVMPALSIVRYNASAGTLAELRAAGMRDDQSGGVAAYEALHSITYTCDQNHTIDRSQYTYSAIICNEADTNALNQLKLYNLELTMSSAGFR